MDVFVHTVAVTPGECTFMGEISHAMPHLFARRRTARPVRRQVRGLPLWAQLLIPLALLIVVALVADAWVFLTTTNSTRAGLLDQTLRDRPARLRTSLSDEANAVLEAAHYLARTGAPSLTANPPDRSSLQVTVNDIYYRFNMDRYGFDLVQVYDSTGGLILSLATDPALEIGPLPAAWTGGLTATLELLPQTTTALLGAHVPIQRGNQYLGQAVVGRVINTDYLTRLKQSLNGQVALSVAGQLHSSFTRSEEQVGRQTLQATLDSAALGHQGTTRLTVGGRPYAATYGPLAWAGSTGGFAVLVPTDDTDRLVDTGLAASLGTLGATLALILIGALTFAAAITRPVTALAQTAMAIQAGDLSRRARTVRHGELGLLGQTFNAMADSLGESLSAARLQREQDRARLTALLSAAASQLAHIAAGQAVAARRQVTAVDSLTVSIGNGGRAIVAIADAVAEVEQAARTTHSSADTGEAMGREVALTMDRLATSGAAIQAELGELLAALRRVQGVMGVLDELSDSVHLLALNATIEAAGAGAYSKRFAVVADAVNNLARRSKAEARRVQQLIEPLLLAGDRARRGAAAGAAEIAAGLPLVQRTQAANRAIAIQAARDLALVEGISAALLNLRAVGEQSLRSARDLDDLAHSGARAAQEVTGGADQLEALALDLARTAQAVTAPALDSDSGPSPATPGRGVALLHGPS